MQRGQKHTEEAKQLMRQKMQRKALARITVSQLIYNAAYEIDAGTATLDYLTTIIKNARLFSEDLQ